MRPAICHQKRTRFSAKAGVYQKFASRTHLFARYLPGAESFAVLADKLYRAAISANAGRFAVRRAVRRRD